MHSSRAQDTFREKFAPSELLGSALPLVEVSSISHFSGSTEDNGDSDSCILKVKGEGVAAETFRNDTITGMSYRFLDFGQDKTEVLISISI